ncbi:COG4223 family protein [Microvirga sp. 2MCAF38]|uniref:COG4223 family protein n=1 Tax=Microvirga sp. 2MCAF38 TaxID=3232989 RepID=UPI003F994A37
MTDSTDPSSPSSPRKKPAREPATIDLQATVIDAGAPTHAAGEESPPADETASVDSGAGVDALAEEPVNAGGAEPPSPSRRDRFGPLVGAGVVGGLIGAGIVLGVQALAPLENPRLAGVEKRIAEIAQKTSVGIVDARLAQLEEARRNLNERLRRNQDLAKRADQRATEALSRPVAAPSAPQDNTALDALSQRIAALEAQVQGGTQSATDAVQGLKQRLGEQEQQITALSGQVAGSVSNAAEASVKLALAERLTTALRQGAPYTDVLDALQKVEGDKMRLAALAPFARDGAPTAASLARSFRPLATTILQDTRGASGTWGDRALRLLDRVVTIRAVDTPDATGVPSLVTRIEEALAQGDVRKAVAAWEAMPEPARRLSEDWGRLAKQRVAADAAAQAVAGDALAGLNRPAQ